MISIATLSQAIKCELLPVFLQKKQIIEFQLTIFLYEMKSPHVQLLCFDLFP